MNILLVGNGAREHALAAVLTKNKENKLFAVCKSLNPGIKRLSNDVLLSSLNDFPKIVSFAKQNSCSLAVIGPENPLAEGICDELKKHGVACFGPTKKLAQLESSKGFTRNLMKKYSIMGMPEFQVFSSDVGLQQFVDELSEVVVKQDGLAGGKGVQVQGDHFKTKQDAINLCKQLLSKGESVVVEEKLVGQEFSLMSVTDGATVLDTPVVQDHKRAFENDEGNNTGGMGSYSCEDFSMPFLTQKNVEDAHEITVQTMNALKKELGEDFIGVMYGGFIATSDGVKLIEYNCRFGDPEAMNVLSLLKTDFAQVALAATQQKLSEVKLEFEKKASVCKYLVPNGYPEKPISGQKILVDEQKINSLGGQVYYASVDQREDGLYLGSSRSVAVVGFGKTVYEAEKIAEECTQFVSGPVFHRKDIGTKALIEKRIQQMKQLRGI